MALSLGSWRPRHLFLAWLAYWLVLLTIVARAPLIAAMRAMRAPPGHGSIGANVTNSVFSLTVTSDSLSWTGSAPLTTIALWIAGPPLVLWLLWMVTRPRPVVARERTL